MHEARKYWCQRLDSISFDGHVALFATQPIEDYVDPITLVGGDLNIPEATGTIFVLCKQY